MTAIDLNCDMAEGFPHDEHLMDYVSSINIACGYHAGNVQMMRETVKLAMQKQVAIGAHPSFQDRINFGRSESAISAMEVFRIVTEQIRLLMTVCDELGAVLHHVKPHGALYNQAAREPELAMAIAQAVQQCNGNLILYGLANSELVVAAKKAGLRSANEAFADRTYCHDGSLTPRSMPDASIIDTQLACAQVLEMVQRQQVRSTSGEIIKLVADTVCIHGDGDNALAFAREIRQALLDKHISISCM